uniref:NS1 protein n=1 Tax=Miniopterus bat parvovirus TaxID=3141923 RepID=A0AAU7E1J1_9VIRU
MASHIPLGTAPPTPYKKFTQYIFDFSTENLTILEPDSNDTFVSYNRIDAKYNTLKYNKYTCTGIIISSDKSSFDSSFHDFLEEILDRFSSYKQTINGMLETYNMQFLGILERNSIKGWHFHLLLFHIRSFTTENDYKECILWVFNKFVEILSSDGSNNWILNHEKIRSVGSYVHYVKKDPHVLLASTLDVAQMYVQFERTHIFPAHTAPKFTNKKQHTLPVAGVVEFFQNKLNSGAIDYEQCLQDPRAELLLGNRNIKEIFDNVRTNFLANRTIKDAVREIILTFIEKDKYHMKCICPIIEYLKFQQIDLHEFSQAFRIWLQVFTKKNTLCLQGPPDTGKSEFFSSLHNIFRFNNRLSQDGIFTFANTINADVAYHEEPFITPETCEIAKLVYEGCKDSCVAVKNKNVQRLNKRIPVLITTNDPVWKWVSGSANAFKARMSIFKPQIKIIPELFCEGDNDYNAGLNLIYSDCNKTHRCFPLDIDIKHRAYSGVHGELSEDNNWEREFQEIINKKNQLPSTNVVDCKVLHKIKSYHWRTFVVYIIFKYHSQYIWIFNDLVRNKHPIFDQLNFDLENLPPNTSSYFSELSLNEFMKLFDCTCYSITNL